jgi:hypothetical protein
LGPKDGVTNWLYVSLASGERLYLPNWSALDKLASTTATAERINSFLALHAGLDPSQMQPVLEDVITQPSLADLAALGKLRNNWLPYYQHIPMSPAPPLQRATTTVTTNLALPTLKAGVTPAKEQANIKRLLGGVITLQASSYRRIAEDPSLTTVAMTIVMVTAISMGLLNGLTSDSWEVSGRVLPAGLENATTQMLLSLVTALIGWWLGSLTCAKVAGRLFDGRTNVDKMLRVFGFVSIFCLLWLLPPISVLTPFMLVWGALIAIREVAEFSPDHAIKTAVIGWTIALLITWGAQRILTLLVLAPLVARIGVPV